MGEFLFYSAIFGMAWVLAMLIAQIKPHMPKDAETMRFYHGDKKAHEIEDTNSSWEV